MDILNEPFYEVIPLEAVATTLTDSVCHHLVITLHSCDSVMDQQVCHGSTKVPLTA